jgi:hypothetical protein
VKYQDLPTPFLERTIVTKSGCWQWIGTSISNSGYASFSVGRKTWRVHRYVLSLVEPLIDGMVVDHLCKNRLCCNPEHLEQVTPRENVMRSDAPGAMVAKTGVCPQGHSMEDAYVNRNSKRVNRRCRPCTLARNAEAKARRNQK